MEIVQNHPYRLCEIDGIGFRTADRIALNMGVSGLSPERVDEGILYTLEEQEGKGHLCIRKNKFIKECIKTLDTPELTGQMIGVRASNGIQRKTGSISGLCIPEKDIGCRGQTGKMCEGYAETETVLCHIRSEG